MKRFLHGRVVDESGEPLGGLRIEAWDIGFGPMDRFLGAATTDADGAYRLAYPPARFRLVLKRRVDVLVVVFDALGARELGRTPVHRHDGRDEVVEVPVLALPNRLALGVASTLRRSEPAGLSRGNAVTPLVDHHQFGAVLDAIRRASDTICLTQLLWPPDFASGFIGTGEGEADPVRVADEILKADRRGVRTRILLNENAMIPDSVDELTSFFVREGARRVSVRGLFMSPNVLHAKVVVSDDAEAVLVGSPFEQRFWDTSDHLPRDRRRGTDRPTHDVALLIRGPAVRDVAAAFASVWNSRWEDDVVDVPAPPPPAGNQTVQILRTMPPGVASDAPGGERGILEAYLRAIATAEKLVYIENQYFTNESVTRTIDAALDARPGLEVVLVLNESVDIPTYEDWQERRVEELGYPDRPRLGVFVLGAVDPEAFPYRVAPIYVHAKAIVVDDRWAMVGAANLDSASLEEVDEFAVPFDPNVEVNAALFDGADGEPVTGVAADLRSRLWSEHLEMDEAEARRAPERGSLALWRMAAEANLDRIASGGRMRGRVLPYDPDRKLTAAVQAPG